VCVTDRGTVQRCISSAVGDIHVDVPTADKARDDHNVAVQRRSDQQLRQHLSDTLSAFSDARSVCQRAVAVAGDDGVDRERDAGVRRRLMSHHVPLRSHARRRVVPRRLTGVRRPGRRRGRRRDGVLRPSVDH